MNCWMYSRADAALMVADVRLPPKRYVSKVAHDVGVESEKHQTNSDESRGELCTASQSRFWQGLATLCGVTCVLSFRYAGLAQTFNRALASRQVDGIVARCTVAKAADSEGRIECQSYRSHCPRVIQLAAMRQRSGKIKMRGGIISVKLDAVPQPCRGF